MGQVRGRGSSSEGGSSHWLNKEGEKRRRRDEEEGRVRDEGSQGVRDCEEWPRQWWSKIPQLRREDKEEDAGRRKVPFGREELQRVRMVSVQCDGEPLVRNPNVCGPDEDESSSSLQRPSTKRCVGVGPDRAGLKFQILATEDGNMMALSDELVGGWDGSFCEGGRGREVVVRFVKDGYPSSL